MTWEFDRTDTTIRKEPPDQVLIAISQFITPDNLRWEGTVTELLNLLDLDVQPNALGMMLNIRTGRLYEDYQIRYETKRTHSDRKIFLTLETVKT